MQRLEIFQSLWAMEQRHPTRPEAPLEEKFRRVAEAGYQGLCLDPSVSQIEHCLSLAPLFAEHGLKSMVNGFPHRIEEMRPLLEMAKALDAVCVNVIGQVMPVSVAGAIPVVYRWMQDADDVGVPLLIETHREGLLNDLFYTLEVIDSVPDLRLCADLSHFVVDREFRLPLSDRDAGFVHRILERSDCFQGRVAGREQVQLQIGFTQHQEWVEIFKGWWREGMRMWRARNADDATLVFLCELGPPPYAMTDANQEELSDRWEEALVIRGWVEEIWRELEAEEAGRARG